MRKTLHVQRLTRLSESDARAALEAAATALQVTAIPADSAERLARASQVTSGELPRLVGAWPGASDEDHDEEVERLAWNAFQYALTKQHHVRIEVDGTPVGRVAVCEGRTEATSLDVNRGAVRQDHTPCEDREVPLLLAQVMRLAEGHALIAYSAAEPYLISDHVTAYAAGRWPSLAVRRTLLEPYTVGGR